MTALVSAGYVALMKTFAVLTLLWSSLSLADEPDATVVALDAQAHLLNKGALRIAEPVHGFAPQMDWAAALRPGDCYIVVARGTAGVRSAALTLFSPDGKRVAASKPGASSLRYCATWIGDHHVQVKTLGNGPYLVGTYVVSSKSGMPTIVDAPPPLVAEPTPAHAPVATPAPAPVYVPVYTPYPVYDTRPTYVTGAAYPQPVIVNAQPQPHNIIITPVIGTNGAECSSSNDCGSGEFCKADSTGFKVCMGEGIRGMACTSSIDCGSGLFCKETNGFKSCR